MKHTTLPLRELSVKELYNGSQKMIFEVPIYQRNYAWEKDEVSTLVQDVYDAWHNNSGVYFIGTLVTFHKGDRVYEVIDGQQRLTTLNLILHALDIQPSNQLTYRARKKSNHTIKSIPVFDTDEKDYGIVNGFSYAKAAIAELVEPCYLTAFREFFQNQVHIIHYEVPRDIDLNHYFEIMNSRGEQLEKHEIIKARLISFLTDKKDKALFHEIWESCSEMGVYVQQKYPNKKMFGDKLCELSANSFDELHGDAVKEEESISIRELLGKEPFLRISNPENSDDKPDSFQPIIDFPNFLLTVLKITRITTEADFDPVKFNLDDKELIREFESALPEHGEEEGFVKKFAYHLLKAKFLLDNYIVHHSKEEDTQDNNPWKLQYWKKEKEGRGIFYNLCDQTQEDRQLNLLHLLSMFEVSFTARQRKNYLFYCLLFLFEQCHPKSYDCDILPRYEAFLEKLAAKYFYDVYLVESKLNNINVPRPGSFDEALLKNGRLNLEASKADAFVFEQIYGNGTGTEVSKGVPLFIFNYLDYKIWKYYADQLRGEKLKEQSATRKAFFGVLGCGDFKLDIFKQFYFSRTRRSLEHYYPQANVSPRGVTVQQINCLGNYAMIGSEANSSGSNYSPKAKLIAYLDTSGKIKHISIASLKFMIMMQICQDNQNVREPGEEWVFEDIQRHQKKMQALLLDEI